MDHYVYIIYSKAHDRFYIGHCSDISNRLKRHNDGATPSTKPYRPWEIVYYEILETKSEAIKREKEIKKQKSRIYIEKLIKGSSG